MALLLSIGEPSGIGPDIALAAAAGPLPLPLIAFGDRDVLTVRAERLRLKVTLTDIDDPNALPADAEHVPGHLPVCHVPVAAWVIPGHLEPRNASSVLRVLDEACRHCLEAPDRHAMVTAPVHKGVINDGGVPFSGHTEYLAHRAGVPRTVMLLAARDLRVALATTHLPLRAVPDAITRPSLEETLEILHRDLVRRFAIAQPRISVCGLNPHAGEGGHLGREEIEVIAPVLERLRGRGLDLVGPLPADTAFTPRALEGVDAVLAMYHDQGLAVLKALGFGEAVNITLGLPFVRTSVDHGTALDLAGTGRADAGSLLQALRTAAELLP
jgi:4-hydroxythreonine-4-phosphate dehydrogenase